MLEAVKDTHNKTSFRYFNVSSLLIVIIHKILETRSQSWVSQGSGKKLDLMEMTLLTTERFFV